MTFSPIDYSHQHRRAAARLHRTDHLGGQTASFVANRARPISSDGQPNREPGRSAARRAVIDGLPAQLSLRRRRTRPRWTCTVEGQDVACTPRTAWALGVLSAIAVSWTSASAACPNVLDVAEVERRPLDRPLPLDAGRRSFQVKPRRRPFHRRGQRILRGSAHCSSPVLRRAVTVPDVLPRPLARLGLRNRLDCGCAATEASPASRRPGPPRPPARDYHRRGSVESDCVQSLPEWRGRISESAPGPGGRRAAGDGHGNVGPMGCLLVSAAPNTFTVAPGSGSARMFVITAAGSSGENIADAEVLDGSVSRRRSAAVATSTPALPAGSPSSFGCPASAPLRDADVSLHRFRRVLSVPSSPSVSRRREFLMRSQGRHLPALTPFRFPYSDPSDSIRSRCCLSQPRLSALFLPAFRDDAHRFTPSPRTTPSMSETLHVGTLAGTIACRRRYSDKSDRASPPHDLRFLRPKVSSPAFRLANQTTSSSRWISKASPLLARREKNARPLSVSSSSPATAQRYDKSQPCALKSEIEISFEHSVSIQWEVDSPGALSVYLYGRRRRDRDRQHVDPQPSRVPGRRYASTSRPAEGTCPN